MQIKVTEVPDSLDGCRIELGETTAEGANIRLGMTIECRMPAPLLRISSHVDSKSWSPDDRPGRGHSCYIGPPFLVIEIVERRP